MKVRLEDTQGSGMLTHAMAECAMSEGFHQMVLPNEHIIGGVRMWAPKTAPGDTVLARGCEPIDVSGRAGPLH